MATSSATCSLTHPGPSSPQSERPLTVPETSLMSVQRLNRSLRDQIYHRVLTAAQEEIGSYDPRDLLRQCLTFAWHGYRILSTTPGVPRTILQAGSAQW